MLSRVSDNDDSGGAEDLREDDEHGGPAGASSGDRPSDAQTAQMLEMKAIIEALLREKDALETSVGRLAQDNETLRSEQEARREDVTDFKTYC